jgi:hypothetical protein
MFSTLFENLKRINEEINPSDLFQPWTPEEIKDLFIQNLKDQGCFQNPDGTWSSKGNVDIADKSLKVIPVQFKEVGGGFWCSSNLLTSLQGCPKKVGGDFWCNNNQLTSLQGCPKKVGGDFWCNNNQLTSLQGCPEKVGGVFWCGYNQLTSLQGCPKEVGGDFGCGSNRLISLQGCPEKVGGNFWCYNKKKFTEDEVRKFCKVVGNIYV